MKLTFNPITGKFDYVSTADDFATDFLKLDQTTPQTIENGFPLYENLGNASISEIFTDVKEPTGFPNRTDSTWTMTGDTISISPALTSYDIWFHGVKHTISSVKTLAVADTEGQHLIYFDTDDALHEYVNPTIAEVLVAIRDKCLVALIY